MFESFDNEFSLEEIEELKKAVAKSGNGKLSFNEAKEHVRRRLAHVLGGSPRAETGRNDDALLEIVGKYLTGDESIWCQAIEICFRQIKSYTARRAREMQIDMQDLEDCFQDVKLVIISKLPLYEAKYNQFSAFITREVNMMLYERKNRFSGVTTNSRYNATITKLALEAKSALAESGIRDPGPTEIARYINTHDKSYKEVTAQMIKNALGSMVLRVDMDDNYPGDFNNPETMALENIRSEELKTMFDSPANSKEASALYKIMYNYYMNPDMQNDKKISVEYIKAEMREIFHKEYTSEKITSLKMVIAKKVAEAGYGAVLNADRMKPVKSAVAGFIEENEELDLIEKDILDAEDLILNFAN